MDEIWKDVIGFEGRYKISNSLKLVSINGRVKGEAIMKPTIGNSGYYVFKLRWINKKKDYRLHRLIAEHFIPNPLNLPFVNHKDGDKLNCSISNLEWVSEAENVQHAIRTGLLNTKGENHCHHKVSEKDVIEMKQLYLSGITQKQIALQYGVSRRQAGDIINGINWKHISTPDYSNKINFKTSRKKKVGRGPKFFNEMQIREIKSLRSKKFTLSSIAIKFNSTIGYIHRVVKSQVVNLDASGAELYKDSEIGIK